jgi:hypothetical protein
MLKIIIILLIIVLCYLFFSSRYELYTDVTKRYPPYHYYANPYYIENDTPYKYFYYYYPKDNNLNYYMPQPYNIGYLKQNA